MFLVKDRRSGFENGESSPGRRRRRRCEGLAGNRAIDRRENGRYLIKYHVFEIACKDAVVDDERRIRSTEEVEMQGYCMKCKAQREIENAEQITMKNGKPATSGTCPVCSTKIFRMGKA
jgi:hypothetical protein